MSTILYVPYSSLSRQDIKSLVNVCLSEDTDRVDTHGGRQIAIKYLLTISRGIDLTYVIDLKRLLLQVQYDKLKQIDLYKREFDENQDSKVESYWELSSNSQKIHQQAKSARQFTNKQNAFSPEQLKIYFNTNQIHHIPFTQETFQSHGFVDSDIKHNMISYPVMNRVNRGQINTKKGRIEQVIFEVPSGKQVIVLDFADDRIPGGLFLHGATTQEETICYNSDLYRALLDLKYNRFDGGFMIPEFGCLYIKNVQFYKPPYHKDNRDIDVVASACYDLTGRHGLYTRPNYNQIYIANTRQKFETIIAAAQANSKGNGKDTYLILGPIGTGAFQNDIRTIARLWVEVLRRPLNIQFYTEQRHAFQHIWFIDGNDEKLQVFEQAFGISSSQRL